MGDNRRGVTLLETVGSLFLVGLVITAMLGSIVAVRNYLLTMRHRLAAIHLLSSELEKTMAATYVSVPEGTTTTAVTIDDNGIPGVTSDDVPGTIERVVTEIVPSGYKKVVVTATWTERGIVGTTPVSEEAVTYIVGE